MLSSCRYGAMLGVLLAAVGAGIPSATAQQADIRHRFLALDFWKGQLHYVDQFDAAKNWIIPVGGGVQDMQLIGSQQILITRGDGWQVFSLETRKKVAEHHLPELGGTVTAQRRADGTTLVGANRKEGVTIYELDAAGKIARKMVIPRLGSLRLMRLTADGTLLLAENDGATEVSIAPGLPDDKRILRRFKLPRSRNAYMSLKAADGTYWVAGGYSHALYQYKADGTLLRTFEAEQPQGFVNWFYAGFQALKNGHIVQANWTGHNQGDFKEGWKLVEFDADGKVVWHWHVPREQAGTIQGVFVLDELDTSVLNDDAHWVLGPIAK